MTKSRGTERERTGRNREDQKPQGGRNAQRKSHREQNRQIKPVTKSSVSSDTDPFQVSFNKNKFYLGRKAELGSIKKINFLLLRNSFSTH